MSNFKSASFLWPQKQGRVIWPIFLPYLGCKSRCVFCAQELQTGVSPGKRRDEISAMLIETRAALERRRESGAAPPRLAFYGGTFTALPETIWLDCLRFARDAISAGLISDFSCSTRPDSLSQARLVQLRDCGCRLVELGVQSFDDQALARSGRGYSGEIAAAACRMIRETGLKPGVQLLPGMPGVSPEIFIVDVKKALELGAACLRFYPCLVIAGSELEFLYKNGAYQSWMLDQTLSTLAEGFLLAAKADIPVIRIGLAPQAGLDAAILAGPRHECLGDRVRGRALLLAVRELAGNAAQITELRLPDRLRGCLRGFRGELDAAWQKIGVQYDKICWHNQPQITLIYE